jgi:hypothetical protein
VSRTSFRSAPAVLLLLALVGACTSATGTKAEPTFPDGAADRAAGTTARPTSSAGPTAPPRRNSTAGPTLEPTRSPSPDLTPIAIDLYGDGDFVSQARADWCVPASIQTMANMMAAQRALPTPIPSQAKLDRLARALSTDRLVGAGSEPEGWAGALNELGLGPYVVTSEPTRDRAIAAAARALRLTGRPVGLLIWRGAHAWVMSGFEATADPALTDDFAVTHIRVQDPWYPRSSSIWGPAQAPDSRIAVSKLAEDFLRWRRPTVRYPEKDGRFVLVVPVLDDSAERSPGSVSRIYLGGR